MMCGLVALSACEITPLTEQAAGNTTYHGVYDEPLTLTEGLFEGEPFVDGGAARPRAGIADGFFQTGDLDGDGTNEGAVVLWESSAGSGSFHYLAVIRQSASGPENVDTVLIGDRPRLKRLAIADGVIELELVEGGPGDAACCPTVHRLRRWVLQEDQLRQLAVEELGQ